MEYIQRLKEKCRSVRERKRKREREKERKKGNERCRDTKIESLT